MLVTQRKNRMLCVIACVAVFLFTLGFQVHAQDFGVNEAANIGGGVFGTADIRDIIVNIVNIALGFLGIIAVIIIIYGGWLWMSSGGNPDQIDRAKQTLRNAVIGLLVILASWAIVAFFARQFSVGTGGGGLPGGGNPLGNGALGSGIIESVYPPPNATGVARNTNVYVTFKEPIVASTLIQGGGTTGNLAYSGSASNPADMHVRIVNTITGQTLVSNEVTVSTNAANTVFVFDPVVNLGSPIEAQRYRIELTDRIDKQSTGNSAFSGAIGGLGFVWNFTVSNIIDTTPPILVNYLPYPNTTNPRNVTVSMRFNEAINPLSVSPSHIIVSDAGAGGAAIAGTLFQASDYKTIEFLPDSQCDNQPLNTCGEPVFCLPPSTTIETLVHADNPTVLGVDGVEDAAGNSFDGNRNGIVDGPLFGAPHDLATQPANPPVTGDDAFWQFLTNNTIDLTPPRVIERNPNEGPGFHPNLQQPLMTKFDKHLSIATIKPDGSYGDGKEYVTFLDPRRDVGYMTTGTNGNGCSFQCLNEGSDSVFGTTCGNTIIEQGEDCDDGNTLSGDGCSANCLNEGTGTCGDGITTHAEQCDDGNTLSGDGCSSICRLEGSAACAVFAGQNCCGNGQIEVGEACDDVNDPGCGSSCLHTGNSNPFNDPLGYCGDGRVQPSLGEECDNGTGLALGVSGDGCSATCLKEGAACGSNANTSDGFPGNIDPGEDCDGGANCTLSCTNIGTVAPVCGNNTKDAGEDCDLGPVLNESFVFINHTGLAESQQYGIRMGSGIRDLYQNCFLPSAESPQSTYTNCRITQGSSPFGWVASGIWNSFDPFPNCTLQ